DNFLLMTKRHYNMGIFCVALYFTNFSMNKKPLILVTNDDGISAPGIRTLIAIAKEFGEVVVVAPDSPQSGKGHAITVNNTLYLNKIDIDPEITEEYSCSGTPVDCVKMAVHEILNRKPDLCVS